ncbi:unnamed protein product, partial [Didymodactylos carnosus]
QLEQNAIDLSKENFIVLEQHALDEAKERVNNLFNLHFGSIERHLSEQSNNIRTAINDKKLKEKLLKRNLIQL